MRQRAGGSLKFPLEGMGVSRENSQKEGREEARRLKVDGDDRRGRSAADKACGADALTSARVVCLGNGFGQTVVRDSSGGEVNVGNASSQDALPKSGGADGRPGRVLRWPHVLGEKRGGLGERGVNAELLAVNGPEKKLSGTGGPAA